MQKKYLLIILLFLVGITISHAQYTSIPDANFEAALVALGHDSVSGDGQVLTADIATITELDIRNEQITDLTGIEDFVALEELRANFNSISSVDLSQNIALELLFIGDNDLTALDVSANINLDYLSINDLNLTAGIDISQNTKLTNFVAENSNLSTIDVSNNILLQQLELEDNNLTTLDVTNLTALVSLIVSDNQLTTIDLSNNTLLEFFGFESNNFGSLDFSGLSNLTIIDGSGNNNLTTVNLTGVTALEAFQVNTASITSLDFSEATNLNFLSVIGSQLQTLDLRNNTALTVIQIPNNNLTSLDLRNIDVTQINLSASGNNDLDCISVDDVALAEENLSSDFRYSIDCALYTYVPDDNFEAALAVYDDIPGDNSVPKAAIEILTTLDVSSLDIADLTGIQDFIALTSLNASTNNLRKVDLSNNTDLQTVNLEENSLKTLDVSNQVNLTSLEVDNNDLFALNIQNGANNSLTFFDATENADLNCILVDSETYANANFVNIDNQTSFSETDCTIYVAIPDSNFEAALAAYDDISSDGQIPLENIYDVEELDVEGNTISDLTGIASFESLTTLNCSGNNLSTLDLSNNELLETLTCGDNSFSSLDLSNNPILLDIYATDGKLTGIDLKNGGNTGIDELEITGNPDLYCVEVDDVDYANANFIDKDVQTSFSLDCIAPVITLTGANPQTIELGSGYTELGATTDDGSAISIDTSEFMDAVGSYTIYYDATDVSGNAAVQVTRTVDVVDTTAPVITLNGANPQTIELGAGYTELGATTDDGSAVSIDTSEFMDAIGSYTIYYDATDAAGNAAVQVTRTVDVVDTTAPVITLNGANPQTIELGAGYTELGATTDDGSAVSIDTSEFMDAVGSYTIYYDATDAGGNAAVQVTRTVDVVDTANPTAICQNITLQLDDAGNASITAVMIDNGSTDLSSIASLALDITDFDCTNIGDNMVTLTVTDTSGNTDMCMATVTIEDAIAPEFDMTTVPTDMEVPFDSGNMYTLADFTTGVVVTDNCDSNKRALATTITQSPEAGTLLAEGDHVITLNATDDNSNIETISFTITVSGVLSVEENTEDIFSIYPNPATDQFWITGVSGEAAVTFYDINGRMLQTIKVVNNQAVSTTDLSEGVYLITIEQNDVNQTIRLIKK